MKNFEEKAVDWKNSYIQTKDALEHSEKICEDGDAQLAQTLMQIQDLRAAVAPIVDLPVPVEAEADPQPTFLARAQ
jgi:hypothetical protein